MKYLILGLTLMAISCPAKERKWTSSDGTTVTGEIVSLEGDQVALRTAKGVFKFPLTRLSKADQDFAKEWKKEAAESSGRPTGKVMGEKLDSVRLGEWPKSVSADFDLDQIVVVKENKEAGEFIYRSPHFEFQSSVKLSKSVVREFSRIFEATYEMTRQMPLGLDPLPWGKGFYLTKLYPTRNAYYADGGMRGSGGMFSWARRGKEITQSIIKVPLPNLGVEYTGTRFIVDHKKRSDTLVHEITHQMTGRWLALMPTWFTEGLAETVSVQRFNSGRFNLTSMDRSIREDVVRRSGSDREFVMLNLERLMTITGREWAQDLATGAGGRRNYPSANLLFYYFARLEGEGNGENLVEYMKAISEGMKEGDARTEILLGGRSFESLQEDVSKCWRSEGLRLTFD